MADIFFFATFLICNICIKILRNHMLASRPILSIEITKNAEACSDIAASNSYRVFATRLQPTTPRMTGKNAESIADRGAFFFLHGQSTCRHFPTTTVDVETFINQAKLHPIW
jgi:hypothetical protein